MTYSEGLYDSTTLLKAISIGIPFLEFIVSRLGRNVGHSQCHERPSTKCRSITTTLNSAASAGLSEGMVAFCKDLYQFGLVQSGQFTLITTFSTASRPLFLAVPLMTSEQTPLVTGIATCVVRAVTVPGFDAKELETKVIKATEIRVSLDTRPMSIPTFDPVCHPIGMLLNKHWLNKRGLVKNILS
jgi:hypothetical protein